MTAPAAPARNEWTVLGLVEWTTRHLGAKGFDEARLNVELLLAHVLQLRRLDLYLQFDRLLRPAELAAFKTLYERRLTHEPLQYILGETEFMGLRLAVNPAVLIPRPETEHLVEQALAEAGRRARPDPDVLDIGTGSGNIALAIARNLPGARITAVDISRAALEVAAGNARRHAISSVTFLEADVFGEEPAGRCYDLVVSNPPYIPAEELAGAEPEVREFEPRAALTDGGDGLRFLARIAARAGALLNPGGTVLVEVGHGQAEAVCALFTREGLADICTFTDYAGIRRVVSGRKP